MDQTAQLKSKFQLKKEALDQKIYDRFSELKAVEGSAIHKIYEVLLVEFPEVNTTSTLWAIRKRVEKRKN